MLNFATEKETKQFHSEIAGSSSLNNEYIDKSAESSCCGSTISCRAHVRQEEVRYIVVEVCLVL